MSMQESRDNDSLKSLLLLTGWLWGFFCCLFVFDPELVLPASVMEKHSQKNEMFYVTVSDFNKNAQRQESAVKDTPSNREPCCYATVNLCCTMQSQTESHVYGKAPEDACIDGPSPN